MFALFCVLLGGWKTILLRDFYHLGSSDTSKKSLQTSLTMQINSVSLGDGKILLNADEFKIFLSSALIYLLEFILKMKYFLGLKNLSFSPNRLRKNDPRGVLKWSF